MKSCPMRTANSFIKARLAAAVLIEVSHRQSAADQENYSSSRKILRFELRIGVFLVAKVWESEDPIRFELLGFVTW